MKPPRSDVRRSEAVVPDPELDDATRRFAMQYGQEYFEQYGRGPHQYQVGAPYRLGEPVWQNYFRQIAGFIVSELGPTTVLDAGCAIGFLVMELRARGVEAWGIDISDYAIGQVDAAVAEFCSLGSVTDELPRDFDLIVCTEVLEHLPQHLAPVVLANFGRHTNAVLFSASPDVFRDPTHQNVQPTDYWVELFAREGFYRHLDVDANVVSPQTIYFVRAGQTAVSVARAYERWHWRSLTELRELRAARQLAADEFVRSERTAAETRELHATLERQRARAEAALETLDQQRKAVERAEAESDLLAEQLEHQRLAADQAEVELTLLRGTRTFRYTARARGLYGRLRRARRVEWRLDERSSTDTAQEPTALPGIEYAVDAPRDGQVVAADRIIEVHGWALCEGGPVARVEISIDGVVAGKARLGLPRPDVSGRSTRPDAFVSGFEALVELDTASPRSEATVELVVESLAGARYRLSPISVRLPTRRAAGSSALPMPRRGRRAIAPTDGLSLLVFAHQLGLGGGQLYLFELLRLLARLPDFAATVVAPEDGPLRPQMEELGLGVVITGHQALRGIERYEARQAELTSWARERWFNAVLANTLGSFPGVDLAERLRVPAVWAIHESFSLPSFWRVAYGPPGAVHPLVQARAEAALASAGAVVFEADATRDLFVRHGDSRRFVTVPYGIDIDAIASYAEAVSRNEARRRLKLSPEATVLLCLGTIEPRKGQAALAEAFSVVAREHPSARLVFVGARMDEQNAALEQFIRTSGLGDRIRILPVTPEIYVWYRAVDALVCASDVESLPRTVLEAMAFSVPVVATRVFGLPELIEDGRTGYLCEACDVGELVGVLDRFLRASLDERRAVAAAGAALVRGSHDSRGYADTYERLLRGLVEDPRRTPAEILGRSDRAC